MKNNLFNLFLLLLCMSSYNAVIAQSCTIDQQYLGSNTSQSVVNSDISLPDGQSFKAGQSGFLKSESMDISASNSGCSLSSMNVRVDILDGDGVNGTQLATETFNLPIDINRELHTFDFSNPAIIINSQMYTITFTLVPGQDCGGGEPNLIWYLAFPTNYYASTGGTQYENGVVASLGNTQYFSTCVSSCIATDSTLAETACNSYTSPSGLYTWTTSGTYNDTIPNALGCDSVMTIHLTINNVNTSVTQNGITLTSDATGSTYKWLNCNDNYSVISNETNQTFTATENGNYVVEVTSNGCTDTSDCVVVNTVGTNSLTQPTYRLYPNPVNDELTIESQGNIRKIEVFSVTGQLLQTVNTKSKVIKINVANYGRGMYLVKMHTLAGLVSTSRIVKE